MPITRLPLPSLDARFTAAIAVALALTAGAAPAAAARGVLADTGAFAPFAVAARPDGGYRIVWNDTRVGMLRAEEVSAAGFPIGSPRDVLPLDSPFVDVKTAAIAADGTWAVFWEESTEADQLNIGGAIFAADGTLLHRLSLPDPIPDPGGCVISVEPIAAALPGGGFGVAFDVGHQPPGCEDPLDTNDYEPWLLHLDTGGTVTLAMQVDAVDTGRNQVAGYGVSASGSEVVVWTSRGEELGDTTIVRSRALGVGAPATATVTSGSSFDLLDVALAVAPDGRFVVFWTDALPGGDSRGRGVWMRPYTVDGEPDGAERQVDPDSERATSGALPAATGTGEIWATWNAVPGPGGGDDFFVRARPVTPGGDAAGPVQDAWTFTGGSGGQARTLTGGTRGALLTSRSAGDSPLLLGLVLGDQAALGTPPEAYALESPEVPGFKVWVRIMAGANPPIWATETQPCLAEALCAAGALPDRAEVIVRVVGPKPNGFLWPTVVKLSTSQVEVWLEQTSSGKVQYYLLPGASPGTDQLPGMFDRNGFEP